MRLKAWFATCATAVALLGSATASGYDSPQCFWGRPNDPNVVNVAYPDEGATYWSARLPSVPPGGVIELRGVYPHARYMSFNVYDQEAAPVDALADVEIAPDAGSTNPFVAGASRNADAAARLYTLRIVAGPAPSVRAPNTLYLSAAGVSPIMLYRVYVPDDGRNLTGGVGLPRAVLYLEDGTQVNLTSACNPADATNPIGSQLGGVPVQQAFADGAASGTPAVVPASDPVVWEKFFNLPHIQAAFLTAGTPLRGPVDELLGAERGGYLSNAHNAYVTAFGHRAYGEVLVVSGKAPVTPSTRSGQTTMGAGELRYWSLCTNERHSTRYIDCVVDEDVPLDASGRYTIVISAPEHKPCAAALTEKVWLKWGTSPEAHLILRHMLPDAGFASAIQRVSSPGELASVMGDYLPSGTHTTRSAFESGAC